MIQNYKELPPLISNVEASYTWLFRSLDIVVRKYGTPSFGMLTEAKEKNQVKLELDAYFYHFILMGNNADLQVSADNMRIYIVDSTFL